MMSEKLFFSKNHIIEMLNSADLLYIASTYNISSQGSLQKSHFNLIMLSYILTDLSNQTVH